MSPASLTTAGLARAARVLCRRDPDLARVVAAHGLPPLWDRPTGFATLTLIILEQQVSLASARATYERLREASGGAVTPAAFLGFADAELRAFGFSRQKTGYVRGMAEHILTGRFDPDALAALPDAEVRARLVALKGIGTWTADIYLLMALGRPDIWPRGDLALIKAAHAVKGHPLKAGPEAWEALAEPWRPYRAVAARLLWQYYLAQRRPGA